MFIGIDVGTASVRAGIFTKSGKMLGKGERAITVKSALEKREQNSQEIWEAVRNAVKEVIKTSGTNKVKSICFDATCSLAVVDDNYAPIEISPGNNVILWADHRAVTQAQRINKTHHDVLNYLGGQISPEHEIPKLCWIKENMPDIWQNGRFLDLADFLTSKSIGKEVRSQCTMVCKWSYLAHKKSFDREFLKIIGIPELLQKICGPIKRLGSQAGTITKETAEFFSLPATTIVATGVIDAHAGGLGLLGAGAKRLNKSLAMIGGTSTCHMVVSKKPRFVSGVWGPYYNAMVPGMWLNEGGESATGALLDYTVRNSNIGRKLLKEEDVYQKLNKIILEKYDPTITKNLHVLPYYHGNRSPRADPNAKGTVDGLCLDTSIESLTLLYYATVQALGFGTRHIIETMNKYGYEIEDIYVCGGLVNNSLWLREQANITGCRLLIPEEKEAVVLGDAMLAATAAGAYENVKNAMKAMSRVEEVILPLSPPEAEWQDFYERKYKVFKLMYEHQLKYKKLMKIFEHE